MTRVRVMCHQCDTSLSTCDKQAMCDFIGRHSQSCQSGSSIMLEDVYSAGVSRLFAEAEKILGDGQ